MFKTEDFNFNLPQNLIAQEPTKDKDKTPMLVFQNNQIFDKKINDLINYFEEGDVMIFNSVKVIKAKLIRKILRNSAIIEFNLDQCFEGVWDALCKPAKKISKGDIIEIASDFFCEVVQKNDDGFIKIKFNCIDLEFDNKVDKYGFVPLPPYIKRHKDDLQKQKLDQKNYQTCYANSGMAVAAPTAGLHFNQEIINKLLQKNIKQAFINLNVGAGTFLPVRSDLLSDHKMHKEFYEISKETCDLVNYAKANNKKIVAVGTTSLRALESCVDVDGKLNPTKKFTDIFIYPPYELKIVDVLMTNFHLPKSTLFMLVCAFVGYENALKIYDHAINKQYRFYSYGDSSLLFRNQSNI